MVEHHDPVGQRHGLGLVVGDVDHGGVETVAKPRDLQAHPHSERGVEVGERLVEQKDLRVADDGPPDGHALALPAGELARVAPEQRLDLKGRGNLGHTPGNLGLRDPGQPQPESDVLRRRHVGEERVGLEHHRHPAPRQARRSSRRALRSGCARRSRSPALRSSAAWSTCRTRRGRRGPRTRRARSPDRRRRRRAPSRSASKRHARQAAPSSALHRPHRHPLDEVALEEQEHHERRQARDQRQRLPAPPRPPSTAPGGSRSPA